MKKLLAIILVVLMSVSVMLFTACEKNEGDNSSNQGRQSSSEEESSTRKRGDGATSSGDTTSTSSIDGGNAGNSGNGGGGGTSSNGGGGYSSSIGGGNYSSYQPSAGSYVYGAYPYSYSTSITQVTFDLTKEYTFVDNYIMELPAPSLNGTFYDSLVDAEDAYNALSASDKGMVANYSRLVEARTAYDDMASQEATSLINELIDPSMENLTQFANQKDKIQALLDKMSSNSGVSNLSTYNTKVSNSQSIIVTAFKNAVSEIATFEYSNDYKTKLDNASSVYNIVTNANLQSQVTSEKTTLDNRIADWNNRVIAGGLEEILAELPGVDNLTENDKATIKALRKSYRMLTDAQKAILPAETTNLYNAYVNKAQTLWPEYIWYINESTYGGSPDGFFVTYKDTAGTKASNLGSTGDGANAPGVFEGETLTDGAKFKTDRYIHFTTTTSSIVTIVANFKDDGQSGDVVALLNGTTEVARVTVTKQDPSKTEYTLSLPNPGKYVLQSTNGVLLLFAVCVN